MLLALVPAMAFATAACDGEAKGDSKGVKSASAGPLNPAMSAPDQVAWNLFIQAVTPTDGAGTALETWPSDTDTFQPGAHLSKVARDGLDARPPVIPGVRTGKLAPAVLGGAHRSPAAAAPQANGAAPATAVAPAPATAAAPATPSNLPPVVPNPQPPSTEPGAAVNAQGNPVVVEEVRRNPAAFNYIVNNGLNSKSGLIKAFNAISTGGPALSFPVDSIEVKTNWLPVALLPQFYPGVDPSQFYLATDMVQGQTVQYALIAMHVISKQVPSWTWATFEHQANPGRCDFLGCKDSYGAVNPYVAPVNTSQGGNQGTTYAACAKTPALQAAFAAVPNLNAAFANYCLKGSQTDWIDNGGLAIRLGNSVTESGFVPQASCMSCHGAANFTAQGVATTGGGFAGPTPTNQNAFVGPTDPSFYYSVAGGQPFYQGQPGLVVNAVSADFVWSIPFCAYDDVTDPAKPVANPNCVGK
jgi:hypothetical protein